MIEATVSQARTDAVLGRIGRAADDPACREALILGLVDATIDGDGHTLGAALQALRELGTQVDAGSSFGGWIEACAAFSSCGWERMPPRAVVASGTLGHRFLSELRSSRQLGSSALQGLLGTDATQVSRTGRSLLDEGLVGRRKIGRQVFWSLTPRGRRSLDEAPAAPKPLVSNFWQEALRRGFTAAYGDEPGEPRKVDPTRERIIKSTLDLHISNGIQATTWPEIAERADVPLGTVQSMFSSQDDLVRSCGEHVVESLRLPPDYLAPEVFIGTGSDRERLGRLVSTLFEAYERAGDGIAAGRRERADLPALEESMSAIDYSFDGLVREALRSRHSDDTEVAAVRALTDLEIWRALRDGGADSRSAIEQARTVVQRWLQAQPA